MERLSQELSAQSLIITWEQRGFARKHSYTGLQTAELKSMKLIGVAN